MRQALVERDDGSTHSVFLAERDDSGGCMFDRGGSGVPVRDIASCEKAHVQGRGVDERDAEFSRDGRQFPVHIVHQEIAMAVVQDRGDGKLPKHAGEEAWPIAGDADHADLALLLEERHGWQGFFDDLRDGTELDVVHL